MDNYLLSSNTSTPTLRSASTEKVTQESIPNPNSKQQKKTPTFTPPAKKVVVLDEEEEDIEVKKSKRKSSKTSEIWDHFTVDEGSAPNDPRAICNYCGKDYACSTKTCGTSTMWVHIKKQCKKYPFRVEDKRQKLLSFSIKTETGSGSNNLLAIGYNKEDCRKSLAKMVVLDEIPFRAVEGEGFRQYCQVLQPKFSLPSRVTVARDILELFIEERAKLKSELKKNCQRLCLTTDGWTSLQNICYMCLTGHYIDCDWKLQKRILNFCIVPNHKGETIGKIIEQCLHGWGVDKLFTVTVDNAISNDSALTTLRRRVNGWNGAVLEGEFMHVRCSAHIINLIVTEGLKELHGSIVAIRNAVRYVRSSPARLQKFKTCVEQEKIEYKGLLVLDVPTRWNSTYRMLDVATKFQKAFKRYEEEDDKYKGYFSEVENGKKVMGPPLSDDWDNAKVFVQFLKTFYDITLKFSASLHVTSNVYYHDVCSIHMQLVELSKNKDTLLSNMAIGMKRKFEKYWANVDNLNIMMFIAFVLDPRYKMEYLKYLFGMVYDAVTATKLSKKVDDTLQRLLNFYSKRVVAEKNDVDGGGSSHVGGNIEGNDLLRQFLKQKGGSADKNDLERYLTEESVDPLTLDFDILSWWKENQRKYMVLSQIARDVLAIQVSTVASESAFSTGGKILDPFRSSLSPKMVEALICTQNWIKSSHEGIQVKDYLDELQTYENIESKYEAYAS